MVKFSRSLPKYILYISPSNSSFVKKDVEFLREKYNVNLSVQNWSNKYKILSAILSQFYFLVSNRSKIDVILVMFAGHWSLIPSLFGKTFNIPVFIILGGTDCVSFPHIDYGSLRKKGLKWSIRKSLKRASTLLPVDESLIKCDYIYDRESVYKSQGYQFFFPEIKTPSKVIYNGFDSTVFSPGLSIKRDNTFISVAGVHNNKRFRLKGFDLIFAVAKKMPEISVHLVGIDEAFAKSLSVPKNVTIHPFLSSDQFKGLLMESRFYLQLSISEGFPNSLCEGMLCECVPIGSSVGAIPNIIANTGFICRDKDSEKIEAIIRDVTRLSGSDLQKLGKLARERIKQEYSIEKRAHAFFKVIDEKIS